MLPSSWTLGDAWLSSGAERLIAGSLQGAIAAAVVWLICRRVTTIPSAMRAVLWWLVSLKLVLSLISLPSLPVPLLPMTRIDEVVDVSATIQPPAIDVVAIPPTSDSAPVSPEDGASTVGLLTIAMGLWFAGVLMHAVRLLWTFASLRRTLRESTRVGDEDAAIAARMARLLGLRVTPDVRVGARVSTPFVVGLLRPTVLLPEHAVTTLTPDERAMAICHELAHLRRRDLLLGWVPAIAERLFFFHPLARLAAREYATEREAACDALVLRAMDVAPRDYGQMLVRLGVSSLTPVFTAGGSSPSRSTLRRRLDMLQDATFTRSRRSAIVLIAAMSAAAMMPFHLVAREAAPLPAAQQAASPAAAVPVVAVPAAPAVGVPAVPAVAVPVEVRRVQVAVPVPQTAPPREAAPVRAPQQPTEKRPMSPPERRTDAEQLQRAIEERRANLRETERALTKMRLELETLLAQQQKLSSDLATDRAVAQQRLAEEFRRAAEQSRATEVQRTDRFLQEQMRVLMAEQEKMRAALQQLSAQIEQIRAHLDRATAAK